MNTDMNTSRYEYELDNFHYFSERVTDKMDIIRSVNTPIYAPLRILMVPSA
jgi:hypothetical protein